MNAGYLVAKYIQSKLRAWGYHGVVSWLAARVGGGLAKAIVSRVVTAGATAAAGYIAGLLGAGGALAGVFGWVIGAATGWL
ncbi:MAG: hypothetical protein Q4D79_15765 [Propionibacteriaceae bacterium]|nr:hypothetical protein [Propionibacteriaceae bacterium]